MYEAAPEAARNDPELYELLVVADAPRIGRAREKQAAIREIEKKLRKYGQNAESKPRDYRDRGARARASYANVVSKWSPPRMSYGAEMGKSSSGP